MPSSASQPAPSATLFPYTTLFRSSDGVPQTGRDHARGHDLLRDCERTRAGSLGLDQSLLRGCQPHAVGRRLGRRPNGSLLPGERDRDRKSTRLNSSHLGISYAVFCFAARAVRYTLSLHDALPIFRRSSADGPRSRSRPRSPTRLRTHSRRESRARPIPSSGMPTSRSWEAARSTPKRVSPSWRTRSRSEEHTSELQSLRHLVCRLLLRSPRRPLHSFPTRRSSDLPTEFRRRAEITLEATISYAIANALAQGVSGSTNPFFGDANLTQLGGGSVDAQTGLSFLENAIEIGRAHV